MRSTPHLAHLLNIYLHSSVLLLVLLLATLQPRLQQVLVEGITQRTESNLNRARGRQQTGKADRQARQGGQASQASHTHGAKEKKHHELQASRK